MSHIYIMNDQEEQWLLAEKYHGVKSPAFFADCKQLALGEPLGYLIGYVPFINCRIWLDSRPLIPRPEAEFWVNEALAEIVSVAPAAPRVLDLCAGSGCIGIAIASAIESALVDFSEIDAKHVPTIKKNLELNKINSSRYTIAQTNLFDAFAGTQYDFILANPPYIDADLNRADDSVVNFEPHLALFGGRAGIEIIDQLISRAPEFLKPSGQLWLEHEPEQVNYIQTLAANTGFSITNHSDQYNVARYSKLVLK